MSITTDIKYSVVIPVYNSEKSLEELIIRLRTVFKDLSNNYEIILIDDNSRDNSWQVITELHNEDARIKGFRLIKNYGQHNALMCGFNHVKGKYIITMDDDLQNPPEEIPKLIEKMEESGVDVVTGIREKKKTSFSKSIGSKIYHYLLRKIFDKPKSIEFGSLYLIKDVVIMNIINYKGPNPLLATSILNNTSSISSIKVDQHKRKYDKSNYNLRKTLKHYHDLVINHSTIPLKIIYLVGIVAVSGAIVGLFYLIINYLLGNIGVEGWASLMFINIFFGGLILLALGVIGEYLARVLNESKFSKQYIIKEKIE